MITLCTLEQTYEARDRPSCRRKREEGGGGAGIGVSQPNVDIVAVNASYLNLDPTIIGLNYAVLYPFSSLQGSERDRLMYKEKRI